MAKELPFQVLARDLPTHRKFEISPVLVGEWVAGLPVRDALGAPAGDPDAGQGVADLELYAAEGDGEHVFASGTFKGHVTVACSRCVTEVRLPIDEKLRVTFVPQAEMPEDEAEDEDGAEVAEDDLDVFPFDGERVDLEPLFREQFVLAIPYAPLCREDCKGLCPQCGVDRNITSCTCEPPIDPRLAALKGLKIPS